jgi:hypothetical protein
MMNTQSCYVSHFSLKLATPHNWSYASNRTIVEYFQRKGGTSSFHLRYAPTNHGMKVWNLTSCSHISLNRLLSACLWWSAVGTYWYAYNGMIAWVVPPAGLIFRRSS